MCQFILGTFFTTIWINVESIQWPLNFSTTTRSIFRLNTDYWILMFLYIASHHLNAFWKDAIRAMSSFHSPPASYTGDGHGKQFFCSNNYLCSLFLLDNKVTSFEMMLPFPFSCFLWDTLKAISYISPQPPSLQAR